ncbi:unnamed protein product [Paramecium sonneborni]|uniref:Uncharacterized protein n=1 Tax=Paramecium sonneborni TaxID=65129 RepID=A0A8S1PUQ8_9CILI|nr:unnamed protein product [Paramecium sonneborni]
MILKKLTLTLFALYLNIVMALIQIKIQRNVKFFKKRSKINIKTSFNSLTSYELQSNQNYSL